MPGQRPILAMGFIASLGITFEVLACVKNKGTFWPLLIFLFYIFLPMPFIFTKRIIKDTMIGMNDGSSKKIKDYALFFTTGIIVSSIALPLVMVQSPVEKPLITTLSCFFVELGNILIHVTMALFCMYFKPFN